MTELTREDLYQINEALKTAIKALQNRVGRVAEAEMKELKDAFQLIDAALYPMPAAPEKPAAKAVKLSPAQLKLAHMVDNAGTLRIANYGQQSRTAEAMRKKGLLEITEPDGIWGAYYGLTEAGYAALSNR